MTVMAGKYRIDHRSGSVQIGCDHQNPVGRRRIVRRKTLEKLIMEDLDFPGQGMGDVNPDTAIVPQMGQRSRFQLTQIENSVLQM